MFIYKGISVRAPQSFPLVSGTLVITCEGEYLGADAYAGLYVKVCDWALEGHREVILEFNGVTQVGPEVVVEIVSLQAQLNTMHSRMVLVMGPDSAVHKSLSASGKLRGFITHAELSPALVEFACKSTGLDGLCIEAREIPDTRIVVLDLKGKVLLGRGSLTLRDILDMLCKAGQAKAVLLNMAGVNYIDSSALGEIHGAWVRWINAGRGFELAGLQSRVRNLLYDPTLQFHKVYVIHDTVEAGVQGLKRSYT